VQKTLLEFTIRGRCDHEWEQPNCSAKENMSALNRKLALPSGSSWWPLAGVALLCLVLGFGAEEAREWGRYEREAIEAGEFWRLLTGHLVHSGWSHLWLNLAALGLLAVLFAEARTPLGWLWVLLSSAVVIDVGLYLLQPGVAWYVGLSGVLHGVIAAGSLSSLGREQTKSSLVIVAALLAKLGFEHWFGPLPLTQSASAGPVVVAAHLYGAVGGAMTAIPGLWHHHCTPRD